MSSRRRLGQITVVCGSMFAGKSEELIRLVRRALYAKKRVQVFKHAIDDRYDAVSVVSHPGSRFDAQPVKNVSDLKARIDPKADVIGIEEAQFFDHHLVRLVEELADSGKEVLVAGLDQDFRRQPFGPMPTLLAIADEVSKVRAICVRCGRLASHTQRIVDGRPAAWDDPVVLIGATESYEARCRQCYEISAPARRARR
jgi:thymidine kinase